MHFTKTLLTWYAENKRDFEWRSSKDPYRIWLSEIILQQTRTAQGAPYYTRFIKAFPNVQALAEASEDKVLKLWQGLGYYSRARNLHATAQRIAEEYQGVFPASFNALLDLKGVGDYTASAIASICFGLPEAVVDGNVFRFLSRYFGIDTPIHSAGAQKEFKERATQLMDASDPGTFNQALMEFGALVCSPKAPRCSLCPFQKSCFAFLHEAQFDYPVKAKKTKVKKRFFNYLILEDQNQSVAFHQRVNKGIWYKLFEFPLIETDQDLTTYSQLSKQPELVVQFKNLPNKAILWNKEPLIHKLSHQTLCIRFWVFPKVSNLQQGVFIKDIQDYPVPVVLQNFIRDYFKFDA